MNKMFVHFTPNHNQVIIGLIPFRYELVRIIDYDIDVERYNKLLLETQNGLAYQAVEIDLSKIDIHTVLSWFGTVSLKNLKDKIVYKLVQGSHICGFMHTELDKQDSDDWQEFLFVKDVQLKEEPNPNS